MKFTLNWLRDHLETDATVREIADALTDLGLEVEGVENLAESRLGGLSIGRIETVEQHPNADRLRVCQVFTMVGKKQIICGAPNVRPGLKVVVSLPGNYLHGIGAHIGDRTIRGVDSSGMICSAREMELSDEHDGIFEIPDDSPFSDVEEPFIYWLAANMPSSIDHLIEIAVTPNRPDALGVRGIAFDLAARGIGTMKPAEIREIAGEFPCPVSVSIDEDARDGGCHAFAMRLIRGVRNTPSPFWLRNRFSKIGLRPISALVDVTNFLTFDRNRPLHVFDADRVKGNLRVHRAREGDTMIGLDDNEYRLSQGQVVISDDEGVVSIAGIMGGLRTGCTEETTNVLLEAALWDPIQIARTGRALKIISDARYRNERGIDPAFNMNGHMIATQLILDLCGGEPSEIFVAGEIPDVARVYRFDPGRVQSLVGMEIAEGKQRAILERLGFRIEGDVAHVPSWRPDVTGEADLVEEIVRIESLKKLKGKPLQRVNTGLRKPILSRMQKMEVDARRALVALGYNECVTYSFIDETSAKLFGGGTDATKIANPISSEMSHMRPDLLPGLLIAAKKNQLHEFTDSGRRNALKKLSFALFEVGHAFYGGEPGQQHLQVAGLLVGHAAQRNPHGERRDVDVFDARTGAEAVLAALGAPSAKQFQITRDGGPWWHPGMHGQFQLPEDSTSAKVVCTFGALNPRILDQMDVIGPAVAFVIAPAEIPLSSAFGTNREAMRASNLQATEQHLAFTVDADVKSENIVHIAESIDTDRIEKVRVFDEFSGGSLGEGVKSVAIAVRIRPNMAPLTDAAIDTARKKVEDATNGTLLTQAAEQNFAFSVKDSVKVEDIITIAASADREMIYSVTTPVDSSGSNLGGGMQCVSISVRIQSETADLTDANINSVSMKVIQSVEKGAGGTLRQMHTARRDISYAVKENVSKEDINQIFAKDLTNRDLIESVRALDGPSVADLGDGMKCLVVSVRLREPKTALTSDDIEEVCAKIVREVGRVTGGALRQKSTSR